MSDILGRLDHAIEDWTTSADAMHWSPDAPSQAPPKGEWVFLGYTEDTEPVEWTLVDYSWTKARVTFSVRMGGGTLYYRPVRR